MTLAEIATRIQERARRLSGPMSAEEAQACWEEGRQLSCALLAERERLCRQWMAAAEQASWARSAGSADAGAGTRLLGRG